jgi:hypothetical protein
MRLFVHASAVLVQPERIDAMKNTKKAAAKTPAKKTAPKKAAAKLAPVVAKNEDHVMEAAFDGTRRRPVVAINDEGKLVVCCRRTAVKYGWKLEGALFGRTKSGKVLVDNKGELAVEEPAADASPKRRATDKGDAVVVPKAKLEKVKNLVTNELDELKDILG